MTLKQKRRFLALVGKISSDMQLDVSTVLYFINAELERAYNERVRPHCLRLELLETELRKLAQRENRATAEERKLRQALERKQEYIRLASSRIEASTTSIEQKSQQLAETLQRIEILDKKLADLRVSIRDANKVESKARYDIMLTGHRHRQSNDKGARITRVILWFFSIAAVIIALLLILRGGK